MAVTGFQEHASENCKVSWVLVLDLLAQTSLLKYSTGQRESQNQPRFKGRGNRFHLLMEELQNNVASVTIFHMAVGMKRPLKVYDE